MHMHSKIEIVIAHTNVIKMHILMLLIAFCTVCLCLCCFGQISFYMGNWKSDYICWIFHWPFTGMVIWANMDLKLFIGTSGELSSSSSLHVYGESGGMKWLQRFLLTMDPNKSIEMTLNTMWIMWYSTWTSN